MVEETETATAPPTTAPPEAETPAVTDLSKPDVTQKYRAAADIANEAMAMVIKECVAGADIAAVCRLGDQWIDTKVATMYNRKVEGEKVKKGVAFPTCLSVNEICGHYSPLPAESTTLKEGDLCKIDMGCHIDGFIGALAHTIVVPAAGTVPGTPTAVEGRKADVLLAAWTAAEAALRMVRVGNSNTEVTAVMNKAVAEFKCQTMRGVLSYEMKQHVIDGSKVIISRETAEEKVDEITFEENEVYAVDVFATTSDGKPKDTDFRTTVYKRDIEQAYMLKTVNGRKLFHDLNSRFPFLPFTIAGFEDMRLVKAGISECLRHQLVVPYAVKAEKPGEYVAQFKFTVLLLPGGAKKITGLPFVQEGIKSEHSVQDKSLIELLAMSATQKKPKNKKKPASPAEDSSTAPAADKTVDVA